MGALGGYTITKDIDGTIAIDWPSGLEGDDAVVAFIKDLRQFGIGTTSKMDNTKGMLTIAAGQALGVYQKALMYEPVDFKLLAADDPKMSEPVAVKPPKSVWTLVHVKGVEMTKPGLAGWHALGAYQDELYANTPTVTAEPADYSGLAEKLAEHIPDIRKSVKGPCKCKAYQNGQIWYLIQHLNDVHHPEKRVNGRPHKDIWTRERIADWLDEVDADLAFDPDLPAKREAKRKAALAEKEARRRAVIKGLKPSPEQMVQITADLAEATVIAAGPLKSSMVKLNVAMEGFAKTIHEMVEEIGQNIAPIEGCGCDKCKAKVKTHGEAASLSLYPEKFPDQEES